MICQATPAFEGLRLDQHGAQLVRAAVGRSQAIQDLLELAEPGRAGVRLFGATAPTQILGPAGELGRIANGLLGEHARPVRAILFDKTRDTNWSLGWHQDRVIAVKRRIDVAGFGAWSTKHGAQHVEPPFEIIAGMTTLRLHLDDAGADNAPLLIAPGSHRMGRVPVTEVPAAAERCGTLACLAEAGDVWVYATSILHASDAATDPGHRRVLHVDYAAAALPGGLEWLGV
jgi:hypothetical protein